MIRFIAFLCLILIATKSHAQCNESFADSVVYDSIYIHSENHLLLENTTEAFHFVEYVLWNDVVYVFKSEQTWCCWFRGCLIKTLTREEFGEQYFDISKF